MSTKTKDGTGIVELHRKTCQDLDKSGVPAAKIARILNCGLTTVYSLLDKRKTAKARKQEKEQAEKTLIEQNTAPCRKESVKDYRNGAVPYSQQHLIKLSNAERLISSGLWDAESISKKVGLPINYMRTLIETLGDGEPDE